MFYFGWCPSPNPAGGASPELPTDSLVGFKGPLLLTQGRGKGRERESGEGMERERRGMGGKRKGWEGTGGYMMQCSITYF